MPRTGNPNPRVQAQPIDLTLPDGARFHVFLTHDWGRDEVSGRDNHERVGRINMALKNLGLTTWFDADRMQNNIVHQMSAGIEDSALVICFVTRNYLRKVASEDDQDNCKLELEFAARCKGKTNIIPVVMEEEVKNSNAWRGPVGLHLGGQLYIDLSTMDDSDEKFAQGIASLFDRINNCLRDISRSSSAPPNTPQSSAPAVEARAPSRQMKTTPKVTDANDVLLWQNQAGKLKKRRVRLRSVQQSPVSDETRQQQLQQDLVLAHTAAGKRETVFVFTPTSYVCKVPAKKVRAKGRGNNERALHYFRVADVMPSSRKRQELAQLLLAAETAEDRDEWVRRIQGAVVLEIERAVVMGGGSGVRESSGKGRQLGASSCVKWLRVEHTKKDNPARLLLHGNGEPARLVLETLERHCSRRPCNLLSIFGKAREGKSFLMNLLADCEGLFQISSKSTPCTQV
jgi:hypothetical protein